MLYAKPLERLDIVFRCCLEVIACLLDATAGPHKGDEFAWNDPIQVSILNALIVLVLQMIESGEIVPAKPHCDIQAFNDLERL